MKLYKNTITYQVETISTFKLNTNDIQAIEDNFENCLSNWRTARTDGKLLIETKEIEV